MSAVLLSTRRAKEPGPTCEQFTVSQRGLAQESPILNPWLPREDAVLSVLTAKAWMSQVPTEACQKNTPHKCLHPAEDLTSCRRSVPEPVSNLESTQVLTGAELVQGKKKKKKNY